MNKPLFRWTIGAFAFLTTAVFSAPSQAAPRGEDLLRDAMSADHTVSYVATETTTRANGPTTIARVQKSRGKRRVEYLAPAIMRGDLLLDDGANLWLYHRAEKSAVKTKTTDHSRTRNRDMRNLIVTVKGKGALASRKVWIVQVSTRDKKRILRKVWIDEKTKARLRLERYDDRGQRIETMALSNIKFGNVPASAFKWTPPSGTEVTNAGTLYQRLNQAQRATSWLKVPSQLPTAYVFESAVVNSNDAWLRYSNGVRRFSIFQQRTKDTSSKPLQPAGTGWYWQTNGNRFIIAGLTKAQAEQVSNSVK